MDDRTAGLLRDGSLALVALGALLDAIRRRDRIHALLDPAAAFSGVVGALSAEALTLRHPARTRDLWERPSVQITGLLGTVAVGRSLTEISGARWAAAVCWGLLVYLLLLGFVLAGRQNPLSPRREVENSRVSPDSSRRPSRRSRRRAGR